MTWKRDGERNSDDIIRRDSRTGDSRHLRLRGGVRHVRVLVMLTDIEKWGAVNEIYREYFPHEPPARSAIGVALNNGMKIEIECTALE